MCIFHVLRIAAASNTLQLARANVSKKLDRLEDPLQSHCHSMPNLIFDYFGAKFSNETIIFFIRTVGMMRAFTAVTSIG